jgi:outer membrane protein TolC
LGRRLFDAGLRKSTVVQYTAAYNADVAAYRETVLTAFQQVEDYIAVARYETGLDPYLNVIIAQNTLLSDQQTALNLRINKMTAAVQLIQALGGGWGTTQLPAVK